MNYKIINSGSDSNATVINDIILIDCGISFKKIKKSYQNLKLVLLTHIHSDHFNKKTIVKLAHERPTLRFACCEWLEDPLKALGIENIDILEIGKLYDYGLFQVSPFKLYHDVPQCGWRVYMNDKKLIYATDTRTLEGIIAKEYDVYLIEGNYVNDEELHERAYNPEYESRVKATHLSKEQASKWLLENMKESSVYEFMHQHKEKSYESEVK